jgi:two-component system, OmpR family, sensor kinase
MSRRLFMVALAAPAVVGLALGLALGLSAPESRLYLLISPGLVAGLAGVLVTVVLVVVFWARRRADQWRDAALAEAAARSAEERRRFLMRLDHELKNPLTAIRAGLANVDLTGASEGTAAAVASVSAQTDRITRLVSDLRKLADLETQAIEVAPVDMPGLLHEVAEAIGEIPAARQRSIRVSVPQAPWPLPLLDGDRDLLFIVAQNLVANAVKFTAPGDAIEVRASEDGDALLVEVADTGLGIPPDEIGQVWAELARGKAARSLPGTGIGLALVRVIVTRHGGRVAIRSREGQGTVVSVRLPLAGRFQPAPGVADLRHDGDTAGKAAL